MMTVTVTRKKKIYRTVAEIIFRPFYYRHGNCSVYSIMAKSYKDGVEFNC